MRIHKNTIVKLLVVVALLGVATAGAQDRKLTLEQVKAMVLENNKNLKKAQKNLEAAQAAKASADAANKPSVGASMSGIYVSEPLNALLPKYIGSGSIAVNQVLYAGGKINNARKLSATAVELQTAQKELTEDELLLKVETNYWQMVNVKEKIALAKEYIRMLNALHQDLKNSFDAGLIYKNDLLKVEVQLNEAELNLTKAQDGLIMVKLNLAQLTGLPNSNFDVQDDITGELNTIQETDPKTFIENRPEITLLGKAVTINELQSELLKGDRRPTVALSANGLYNVGKKINFTNGENDFGAFVGLVSINVPVFDWGGRRNKVAEQEFKTQAQKLQLEETKELVQLEIQDAWLALNQSVKRIQLANKSQQQASENLRLNQDRFDAGTILGEDVLQAQALWQKSYSDTIDAKAEYKINEAKYKKAIGQY